MLVVAFVLAQKTGGQIWLGSGYGVDFRVVPFVLLVVYVIVQAHMKPFLLPSDNDLELCCLCGLLLAIYADTSLDQPILRDGKVKLKTVVVGLVVMIVVGLGAGHKRDNNCGLTLDHCTAYLKFMSLFVTFILLRFCSSA